jgi:hypothetical protein
MFSFHSKMHSRLISFIQYCCVFQANQIEEEEGEDEEMGVAETYADYWPSKCKNRF